MALLYKNAKKEVDKEFAEIKAKGYTPVSNKDGTYSWVNAEGGKYTGDLDPTGGRDAEATWGQQHFKRQARQDKIMSRKVSGELAMAPSKPVEKSGTGTGGSGTGSGTDGKSGAESNQSTTITRVEPVAKAKTEGVVSPKNSGIVNIPPSKTLRPSNIPQYEGSNTKPFVPYVSAAETNTEDPYIYVDQEEYQAANPAWSRMIGNIYGGTYMSDIQQLKGGMNTSNIGLQGKAGYVPRTRIMDPGNNQIAGLANMTDEAEKLGHKQVLIKNPNFKKPIGSPAMVAGNILQDVQSLTAPGSLLGPAKVVGATIPLSTIAAGKSIRATKAGTKAAEATTKAATTKTWGPFGKGAAKKATKLQGRAQKAEQAATKWGTKAAEVVEKPVAEAAKVAAKPAAESAKTATQGTLFEVPTVAKGAGPTPGVQYATPNLVPKAAGEQVPMIFRDAAGKIQTTKGAGPPTGPSVIQKIVSAVVKPAKPTLTPKISPFKPAAPFKPSASFKPDARTATVWNRTVSMQKLGGKLSLEFEEKGN